jgi:hypothetical protein
MSATNREDEGSIRTVKGRDEGGAESPRAPAGKKKKAARPGAAVPVARGDDEDNPFGLDDPEAEDEDDEDADDKDADAADKGEDGDEIDAADDDFVEDEDDDAEDDEAEDGDEEVAAGASAGDVPEISRKVRRRRRRSRPRSKTIAMKRLTREELRVGALLYPPVDIPRPDKRSECKQEAGPCPWVACKHHLYLDVNPETGSIKINFPDLEPWEMKDTCALDVAERGGITLEEVGEIMNLTRERIRQVEVRGLLKLKMASPSPDELGAGLLRPPGDQN